MESIYKLVVVCYSFLNLFSYQSEVRQILFIYLWIINFLIYLILSVFIYLLLICTILNGGTKYQDFKWQQTRNEYSVSFYPTA